VTARRKGGAGALIDRGGMLLAQVYEPTRTTRAMLRRPAAHYDVIVK